MFNIASTRSLYAQAIASQDAQSASNEEQAHHHVARAIKIAAMLGHPDVIITSSNLNIVHVTEYTVCIQVMHAQFDSIMSELKAAGYRVQIHSDHKIATCYWDNE